VRLVEKSLKSEKPEAIPVTINCFQLPGLSDLYSAVQDCDPESFFPRQAQQQLNFFAIARPKETGYARNAEIAAIKKHFTAKCLKGIFDWLLF